MSKRSPFAKGVVPHVQVGDIVRARTPDTKDFPGMVLRGTVEQVIGHSKVAEFEMLDSPDFEVGMSISMGGEPGGPPQFVGTITEIMRSVGFGPGCGSGTMRIRCREQTVGDLMRARPEEPEPLEPPARDPEMDWDW
jgi:hypothetical protein